MLVKAKSFWMPKHGNSEDEYEDAFWPPDMGWEEDRPGLRCAIADGATETPFSRAWAKMLTREWCEKTESEVFINSLAEMAREWRQQIGDISLPWYVEEKIMAGAFSSLLGLQLHEGSEDDNFLGKWEATAIGDSCLFQDRNGEIITRFPMKNSGDFNNHPFLLGTHSHSLAEIDQHMKRDQGEFCAGDVFYLMTDALAACYLRIEDKEIESVEERKELRFGSMEGQGFFEEFVNHWRERRDADGKPYLRNDDVTLISIKL